MIVREHSTFSLRTSAKKRNKPRFFQLHARSFRSKWRQTTESRSAEFTSPRPLYQGIAFTDDIIMVDRQGKRIPPPEYASLSIDQLPQFKKG